TAMTLHMTHRDLLIFGYICTAIGYALAPLNAYIIDNLRSRDGKYRVFVKLAIPSGLLSLFALFFPYEKMGYVPMIISLFLIGQIQGYVQGWYSTGVSNLVYVISPNSQERVRIMTVSSLVHNFAPSLTGFLIPVLSDVLADGDLYNIRTYRMIYPVFIVVGVVMSLAAWYGVRERIIVPRSRVTRVGLWDALRAVSKNKLFWIKCSDNWNNFMEDSKNVLMQWLFYYGKVGSMTTYGVMDTLSYNSSMWAMLASPWLIDKLGKKGFKLTKNISQVFITLGLALTYKKSLALIFIFYFLNRFWETTEVIDRAMESDIRDYQQYISGERIDGSFGVVDTYVGGAVGAVTNLFVPWVYRRNGFDGTDYSVLNVFREDGSFNSGNVLYTLLDKLLWISLIGAAVDVLPWFFYDLSDTDQKAIVRVLRLRTAVEDKAAGVLQDDVYCEACEALQSMEQWLGKEKRAKLKKRDAADAKDRRTGNRQIRRENEEIEIASFLRRELDRYRTPFGEAVCALCERMTQDGEKAGLTALAHALPRGTTKEDRALRADALHMAQAWERTHAAGGALPEEPSAEAYEALFDLPEDTPEQRRDKRRLIKEGSRERNRYGKVMKPLLWAERNLMLRDAYDDLASFTEAYPQAKDRLDAARLAQKQNAEEAAARRKREANERREKAKSKLG
ncbi:MAG: MFS transporter, partial [Clostridia bacterium]|nr:MFS transporter [Clostridia bacterium]